MKCDNCNEKKASVLIEQNINGEIKTMHLCSDCAQTYTIEYSLDDVFQSFINSIKTFNPEKNMKKVDTQLVCPGCGMSYTEFKKGGKMGCMKCYGIFGNELDSIFSNIQPGTRHHGKMPKEYSQEAAQIKELDMLRDHLKQAVEEENYEQAATLRDQIRTLTMERGGVDA